MPDDCDIATGISQDINANGVPDECERLGDGDGDGDTDLADFRLVQRCFGAAVSPGGPCEEVDLDGNGFVDLNDAAALFDHLTGPAS